MEIKRIGVLSCVKISTIVYTVVGLVKAVFASSGSLLISFFPVYEEAVEGMSPGIFAIVFFPVYYCIAGAVGGLVFALIYNLAARFVGGIILEGDMVDTPLADYDHAGPSR